MLSRVAGSIYWMNRYIERAENYSRFIDVNHQLMMDLSGSYPNQWMPLVYTTGDHELFVKKYENPSVGNVIQFLTFDTENSNSIFSCLTRARENARTVRENISTTMWEVLNEFYLEVKVIRNDYLKLSPDSITLDTVFSSSSGKNLSEFFKLVRNKCQMFQGTTDSTISHDDVWHFAMIGRNLERSDKTTRILDMKYFILLPSNTDVGSTLDLLQWISLLKSASAHEMYNRVYPKVIPLHIAEFMIQNPQFPRSILFCLNEIEKGVKKVSGIEIGQEHKSTSIERMVVQEVKETSMANVFKDGFHDYLDNLQGRLNSLGASIHDQFFISET
ncbi:alpha-E domain-containing protein [Leptospira sp. GIMC2001]|uniref:alpha-E domain-containing protein n=1 Tax=Leptospira sp. GIMC2001 TaxID=1513297 RepID=UPI0023490E24|nr:alpha-E domain-containing protein [Leptospira sp. GIMC2001]WCL49345.1 alpha-E domain-containing protein [Leptospira sp. GIMC2001]